jgi:hypothetical protein
MGNFGEKTMKLKTVLLSATALTLVGASAAFAQQVTSESYSASVNGALQSDTGFLTGGQVQVNGVGQGSLSLTRGQAQIDVVSEAFGATDNVGPGTSSTFITTMDFDRNVTSGAALVGVGNVVAQGESLAGSGVVGTALGSASISGVGTYVPDSTSTSSTVDFAASSETNSSAAGGLVGSLSTSNTIQLMGSGDLFAGSQSLDIGERTQAFSAGSTGLIAYDLPGVNLTNLSGAFSTSSSTTFDTDSVTGSGSGFGVETSLAENAPIDMNVSNAGNGSILMSGSTGGFFSQGTTFGASGSMNIADVGGFFDGTSASTTLFPGEPVPSGT